MTLFLFSIDERFSEGTALVRAATEDDARALLAATTESWFWSRADATVVTEAGEPEVIVGKMRDWDPPRDRD